MPVTYQFFMLSFVMLNVLRRTSHETKDTKIGEESIHGGKKLSEEFTLAKWSLSACSFSFHLIDSMVS